MPSRTDRIKGALDLLAQRFENRFVAFPGAPNCVGWGQFLDGPQDHAQLGLYGTCAGMMVRALAGRQRDALHQQATNLLRHWWGQPDARTASKLTQIPRLAFLHLALRVAGEAGFADEVAQRLRAELLPGGLYADVSVAEAPGGTPRVLPTGMTLASFALRRGREAQRNNWCCELANRLGELLPGHERLSLLEFALGTLGVVSESSRIPQPLKRRLRTIANRGPLPLEDFGVYFLEYRDRQDGAAPRRDYFIAPTTLVLGLSGLSKNAPGALRVRSDEIVDAVVKNVEKNQAFVPGTGDRISSKNQAWAALLLGTRADGSLPLFGRVWYALRKYRRDNWFTGALLPLIGYMVATVGAVYTEGALKAIPAMGGLVMGGIYPIKRVFDRILGRSDESI